VPSAVALMNYISRGVLWRIFLLNWDISRGFLSLYITRGEDRLAGPRGRGGSIFWKTRDIGLASYSNNLSTRWRDQRAAAMRWQETLYFLASLVPWEITRGLYCDFSRGFFFILFSRRKSKAATGRSGGGGVVYFSF
jgi:hypothetical protein